MAIKIRKMKPDDYLGAIALWQSLPGLGLSSADEAKSINSFLQKNPETCFVALYGDHLVGTVLGGNDGRRGYLYHLAVQADHQQMGLGRLLTEKCLKSLKAQGVQKCHIFVINENTRGLKFWEKSGWKLRNDILVMSKNL